MTWSPTSTTNGWWPRLSPDGLLLAFGNAQSFVADFRTNPPRETLLDGDRAWGGYWMSERRLTFFKERVGGWDRYEVDVPDSPNGPWSLRLVDSLPDAVWHAGDGHYAGFVPWKEVYYDGRNYAKGYGGHGALVAGPFLLQLSQGPPQAFRLHIPALNSYAERKITRGGNGPTLHNQGYIGHGYSGPAYVFDPEGREYDVTATPWRQESSPQIVMVNGAPWVWNASEDPNGPFLIGRPLLQNGYAGKPVKIVRGVPGTALSVVYRPNRDDFVIAGCNAVGALTVLSEPRGGGFEIIKPVMAPFPKKFWMGTFFSFANPEGSGLPHPYGSTPDYPQNCTVVVNQQVIPQAAGWVPIIIPAGDEHLQTVKAHGIADKVLALYIGDTGGWLNAQTLAARSKENWRRIVGTKPPPVFWYITPGAPDGPLPRDVDILGPQLYFDDYHADEARMQELLWRMVGNWMTVLGTSKPWLPVCQSFDRGQPGVVNIPALASMQPQFLNQLTANDPRVGKVPPAIGVLFFAVNRPGGTKTYPELADWHKAIFASIPGPPDRPVSEVPPMVAQPKFTIVEPRFPLDATIPPGGEFRFRCVAKLEPGSGEPSWIDWEFSTASKNGPWTLAAHNKWPDEDHTFIVRTAGTYWIRAKAWNSVGTHITGLERRVTVAVSQPPPDPEPPDPPDPLPPTAEGVTVETAGKDNQRYWLSVGPNGLIEAKAMRVEDAARILAKQEGDLWTLKLGDKFIRAAGGGGGSLFADRDVPGPDEHFTLILGGDGLWTIQTRTMLFTHAEFGGGGRVIANKTTAGAHEFFDAQFASHPPSGGPLLPLRMENGRFRTDAGWIVPRCYSVFHALALVRDGNLPELRRLLDRAQAARCNMVRIFGGWHFIGGGLAPFTMTDPNWFGWMDVVLQEAAARGLYVALSYFCDAQVLVPDANQRIVLFEQLAGWALGKPTLLVMAANEARKNGWHEADDPALLDLVRRFRVINGTTLLGASDPLDAGQEGNSASEYNARQETIHRNSPVDYLLVHPHRKDRYDWVSHLYGAAQTPGAVGFHGICWIEEPMGGASRDVPGRRDGSAIAHIAAACVGAMVGAYTYMHRQLEDDIAPGLEESGIAAEIPGSPDYKFYNATLPGSPVTTFTEFDKCRTCSNGSDGWAVAYGEREGSITLASGWREIGRTRWSDGTGTCLLLHVAR